MSVILWAPWSPQAHKIHIILRDGTEIRDWTVLPGPDQDTLAWAQGINLPALPAEIPIDLASERFPQLPELNLRFFSFWFFGSISWFMLGRICEDIRGWRNNALPPMRRFDLLFAIEAFVLAILSFSTLFFGRSKEDFHVLTIWSAVWIVLASGALSLRWLQRTRRLNSLAP